MFHNNYGWQGRCSTCGPAWSPLREGCGGGRRPRSGGGGEPRGPPGHHWDRSVGRSVAEAEHAVGTLAPSWSRWGGPVAARDSPWRGGAEGRRGSSATRQEACHGSTLYVIRGYSIGAGSEIVSLLRRGSTSFEAWPESPYLPTYPHMQGRFCSSTGEESP